MLKKIKVIKNTMFEKIISEAETKLSELEKGFYIISTPIGNKYDITIRAIIVLNKADTVICEDTRVTKKLFKILNISQKKKWLTYNDHSSIFKKKKIVSELANNKIVALVSDAGTPLISDPGYKLLNKIRENHYKIFCIPGPSASISGLILSGLSTDKFSFLGFLPKNKNDYVYTLKEYSKLKNTLIIFEKSSRVNFLLNVLKDNFNKFKLVMVKEITKIYENTYQINNENINDFFKAKKFIKGELTMVLDIYDENMNFYSDTKLLEELKILKPSQVSAMLSKTSSESREEIYKRCIKLLNDKNY